MAWNETEQLLADGLRLFGATPAMTAVILMFLDGQVEE